MQFLYKKNGLLESNFFIRLEAEPQCPSTIQSFNSISQSVTCL